MRQLLPVLVAGLVPLAVLTLLVIGTAYTLVAWQPPVIQTVQFGTPNSENGVTAIANDLSGIYAVGFVGRSYYGNQNVTPAYLFVSKYGLDGGLVWSNHFDNPYRSYIYDVAMGPGQVFVVGSLNGTSFVKDYDLQGNQAWTVSLPGASSSSISLGGTGLYLGSHNGTAYLLMRYDLNGHLVWDRDIGVDEARIDVYAGSSGLYVVDAKTLGTSTVTGSSLVQGYDFNGTLLWTRTCSCDEAKITGDSSGIYVTGTVQTGGGTSNGFISRYDLSGNLVWTNQFHPSGYNGASKISSSVDSSGLYIAVTTSDARATVLKYSVGGGSAWSRPLPWKIGGVAITVSDATIYLGGLDTTEATFASIVLVAKDSSLVFFGINPPFSFVVLGALVGVVAVSLLLLRREVGKRRRPVSTSQVLRSQGIPTDLWTQPR